MRFTGFVAAALALLTFTAVDFAQVNTAQINGTLTDTQGLVIQRAHVVIRNVGTGVRFEAVTNESGSYSVVSVPVGDYSMRIEHPGFRQYSRTGISVIANQVARVDVQLEVGAVNDSVTVQADVSPVNTTTGTLGTLVDTQRIVDMPLNGRNVLALAALTPGVTRVALANNTSSDQQRINVNGARSYSTNIMLDGASMFHAHRGQGLTQPPPDAVQELQVMTNGVSAEFGRGSAVISTITRSGTNTFHGAVWEYLRNSEMDARSFFAAKVPALRYNQPGGALGGPIRRDKAFFFVSYQHLENRGEQVVSSAFPPTLAERTGDFSNYRDARPIDPLKNELFPGGVIPSDRLDPVALKLAARFPLPNRPDGSYVQQLSVPLTDNMLVARGDYQMTGSDRSSVRYFWNRPSSSNPFGGNVDVYAPWTSDDLTRNLFFSHIHTFSPTVLFSLRGGYTTFKSTTTNLVRDTLSTLGSKFVTGGGPGSLPLITISGRLNPTSQREGFFASGVQEGGGDLSWFHGKHQFKFGSQVQRLNYYLHLSGRSYGEMVWSGIFTKNAMADFFLGPAASLRQEAFRINDASYFNVGSYAQDLWRVSRKLTLTLGLRYEIFTPWRTYDGQFSSLVPGARSQTFPTAPAGLVFQNEPAFPLQVKASNFGPHAAFAYDVFGNGKTSVRGGYTISYDPLIGQVAGQNSPPYAQDVLTTNVGPLTDPQRFITVPYGSPVDLQNPKFILPLVLTTSFIGDMKTAYSQNINLTVEQQVAPDTVLQASYVATLGRHITTTNQLNPAIFVSGQSTTQNNDQRRIYAPNFGSIQAYATDGISSYHGLQVVLNKRFSRGFTVSGAYAFAKSIDEAGTSEVSDNWFPQDPNNRRASRGLSDYDTRNRLVASWIWELPLFQKNTGLLGKALGRWRFGGLSTIQSGLPFNVISGRDNSLRGVNFDRPDVLGDPHLPADRPKSQLLTKYFDVTRFVQNQPGQFGNSGRNILIGPGLMTFDLTLDKRIPLRSEGKAIELRWDVLNALNRANFSNPGANLASASTFGRITSAGAGRIMQLALRVEF